jgi:hypothetical protein
MSRAELFLLVGLMVLSFNFISNYKSQVNSIDLSTGTTNCTSSFSSDYETFEDNQSMSYFQFSIYLPSLLIKEDLSEKLIFKQFLFSIWQPPKVC